MRIILFSLILIGNTLQGSDEIEIFGRALNFATGDLRHLAAKAESIKELEEQGEILVAFNRSYLAEAEDRDHPPMLKVRGPANLRQVVEFIAKSHGLVRPENLSLIHYSYDSVKRYRLLLFPEEGELPSAASGDVVIFLFAGDIW